MPVERRNTIPAGLVAAVMIVAILAASQSSLFHVRTAAMRGDAVDDARDRAARLLGFTAEPADEAHAAVVTSVAPHGAARLAGLEIGDLVVAVDGRRVDTALTTMRHPPHALTIVRSGVTRTLVLQ